MDPCSEERAPAAVARDVGRTLQGMALADEAMDPTAIGQLQAANRAAVG